MTANTVGRGNAAVAIFNNDPTGALCNVVGLSFQPSFVDSLYGQLVASIIPPVIGTDPFFENQAESIYYGDPALGAFAKAGYLADFPISTNFQYGRSDSRQTTYGNLVDPLVVLMPGSYFAIATLGHDYIDCMFEFVMVPD